MTKSWRETPKTFDSATLYKDALYYNLIHRGISERRAKLTVERLIKRSYLN